MTKTRRFLWILSWFGLLIFSQIPLSALILGVGEKLPAKTISMTVIILASLVVASMLALAKKTRMLEFKLSWFGVRELIILVGCELGIIFSNILGSIILTYIDHVNDTANQEVLNQLANQSSLLPFFILTVIVAPIAEEILCRGIIPQKIFYGHEKPGYLVGWLVFTLLHTPTNIGSFIIYGGMSAILTYLAYRSQRLEMSIFLHMMQNSLPFILMLFI